jgi:hypothetical protein
VEDGAAFRWSRSVGISNLNQALRQLVERYHLRQFRETGHYLGICNGLGIDASVRNVIIDVDEYYEALFIVVHSATAAITPDLVLDGFQSFSHLAALSIPTSWVAGRIRHPFALDHHGCVLELSKERIAPISSEVLLQIPEALSRDVAEQCGVSSLDNCSLCAAPRPTELTIVDNRYRIACRKCADAVSAQPPKVVVATDLPIRWRHAVLTIAGCSLLSVAAWGWLLHAPLDGLIIQWRLTALLSFFVSFGYVASVDIAARGCSRGLRLLTACCIFACLIGVSVWDYRCRLHAHGVAVSWLDAAIQYFHGLPENSGASMLVLGALAGIWAGFRVMPKSCHESPTPGDFERR